MHGSYYLITEYNVHGNVVQVFLKETRAAAQAKARRLSEHCPDVTVQQYVPDSAGHSDIPGHVWQYRAGKVVR